MTLCGQGERRSYRGIIVDMGLNAALRGYGNAHDKFVEITLGLSCHGRRYCGLPPEEIQPGFTVEDGLYVV